jgi:hypothetical protein
MNVRSITLLVCLVSTAFAAACGGGQPEPNAPPPAPAPSAAPAPSETAPAASASAAPAPTASAAPSPAPGPKGWSDMSKDERMALMKTQVLPKMKESFQGFDAKRYADFTCKTCHGEGVKEGKFDMPNPKLPVLDATGGFKKEQQKHPKALQFMMTAVVPQMADILGLPKFDPATHQGFGCAACHTFVK